MGVRGAGDFSLKIPSRRLPPFEGEKLCDFLMSVFVLGMFELDYRGQNVAQSTKIYTISTVTVEDFKRAAIAAGEAMVMSQGIGPDALRSSNVSTGGSTSDFCKNVVVGLGTNDHRFQIVMRDLQLQNLRSK